jgi:hypothetical protein
MQGPANVQEQESLNHRSADGMKALQCRWEEGIPAITMPPALHHNKTCTRVMEKRREEHQWGRKRRGRHTPSRQHPQGMITWEALYPDCILQSHATELSDHCPLLLGLKVKSSFTSKVFGPSSLDSWMWWQNLGINLCRPHA